MDVIPHLPSYFYKAKKSLKDACTYTYELFGILPHMASQHA